MAADLHIHAVAESDPMYRHVVKYMGRSMFDSGDERVYDLPNVWVGEVSWLKAAFTGDKSFVAAPVQAIAEIVGNNLPLIDEDFIQKVREALAQENATTYSLNDTAEIMDFLNRHRGERAYQVLY